MPPTKLELLSPAQNALFGMAAIDHGADAVYIGAARFGARAAAGNPVAEIEKLAAYAHQYRAKVYVALNTLLFDHELEDAGTLIRQLWNGGVDALIIQDMGLVEMDLPPIPLFASTQADIRTLTRVQFLEQSGFQRVILARELGLDGIKAIRRETKVELEAFVHGALCAGYSGQCYLSAAIGKRSANRGICGQPCRLAWTLLSEKNQVLVKDKYLLSLKDMNRSDHLAALAAAGITSFKIEGRLKDLAYVKNITAFYRQTLDALMAGESHYRQASSGKTQFFFTPDPSKTFHRGETDYLMTGRTGDIHAFDTPKSTGERLGKVDQVEPRFFTLKTPHDIHNGDGLCYMNKEGRLKGFYVNQSDPEKIYPAVRKNLKKTDLTPGLIIFRNLDQQFAKKLSGPSAQRRIALTLALSETVQGFLLQGTDEDGITAAIELETDKVPALDKTAAHKTMEKQLGRLGDSLFYLDRLSPGSFPWFIPASSLNQLRRDLVDALTRKRNQDYHPMASGPKPEPRPFPRTDLDFRANVANRMAEQFYQKRGVKTLAKAFELSNPGPGTPVMTLKHCIRHALGQCGKKVGTRVENSENPLYLENKKGRFKLCFDCRHCEMRLITLAD